MTQISACATDAVLIQGIACEYRGMGTMRRGAWFGAVLAALLLPTAAASVADEGYTAPFTLEKRATTRQADRYGDLPLGAVIRTDERYGRDGLFLGPRGWDYWNLLEKPRSYQDPNLWPDKRPTYFMAQLKMPPGTDLTLRGRFPHARYFKFALYVFERNTFVALADGSLASYDIEPDPGSSNPYRVGADRTATNRNYTIHVLTEDAPKNRADRTKNTVYAGRGAPEIQGVFRVYVSDVHNHAFFGGDHDGLHQFRSRREILDTDVFPVDGEFRIAGNHKVFNLTVFHSDNHVIS